MRLNRISGILIIAFLLFAGISIAFPQIYFMHKVRYKNFAIYSTENIHENIYSILDTVTANLESSPVYDESLKQPVFICNNRLLYTLYCYPARRTFGGNWELWGKIFIASAHVKENVAFRQMDDKTRTLSNLLTHETTHTLIERYLGFRQYKNLPVWKNEGYCDYVAKGSTRGYQEGINNLCSEKNLKSYFTYRLAVKYLLEDRSVPLNDLFSGEFDYDAIKSRLKEKYCMPNPSP